MIFSRFINWWQRKEIKKLQRIYLAVIFLVIVIFIVGIYYFSVDYTNSDTKFGVTFSDKYARALGLNEQELFVKILDEMKIRKFRLMTYWDDVEPEAGKYNFATIKWQLDQVTMRGGQVILVVGRRQPRWPECHDPQWLAGIDTKQQHQAELQYIKTTVESLKNYQSIVAWQVDNEPFLNIFGKCPPESQKDYLDKLNLVKSLDTRPTIITDSGELSSWYQTASINPIIGTSLYRHTWNQWYGNFYYPLPPAYYHWKANMIKLFTPLQSVFISELQLEPWSDNLPPATDIKDQYQSMNLDRWQKNIDFAKRVGFSEVYLWGVEWWYWLKERRGDDSFWQQALLIFNKQNND